MNASSRLRHLFGRFVGVLTEVEPYEGPSKRSPERPAVGLSAVIVRDGQVLLGRRRGSHVSGVWSTPGGHHEMNETFHEAVRREIAEETGLTMTSCKPLTFTNDVLKDDNRHYVTLYFSCEVAPGEPTLMEPDKCEGWYWLPLGQLPPADQMWPGMAPVLALLAAEAALKAQHES